MADPRPGPGWRRLMGITSGAAGQPNFNRCRYVTAAVAVIARPRRSVEMVIAAPTPTVSVR